jgi:hypothetical protein
VGLYLGAQIGLNRDQAIQLSSDHPADRSWEIFMGQKSWRNSKRSACGAVLLGLAAAMAIAAPANASSRHNHNCGNFDYEGNRVTFSHGRHAPREEQTEDRNRNCDNFDRHGNHVEVPPGIFGDD